MKLAEYYPKTKRVPATLVIYTVGPMGRTIFDEREVGGLAEARRIARTLYGVPSLHNA